MNRTRIVIAGAAPEAEPRYLLVDELGSIVGRGILPVQEASALTPMRTVLVIPGAETSVRWLKPTGASEAQARAAALLSLQDELAQAGEALHLALGPPDETGERAACVLAASRLQAAAKSARSADRQRLSAIVLNETDKRSIGRTRRTRRSISPSSSIRPGAG
ncbi:MAG TPA: hypothetical protein PKB04_13105, partial [Phenylobacterium sp.]|nr:hypothetical protein [Phenylobacterium sp.]